MQKTDWFNRKFPVIEDNGLMLGIIERLKGTPARLEELTRGTSNAVMEMKKNGKWSVKEEIGHLYDLEPLWIGRLDDLVNGLQVLRVTDLTNQKTHEAQHNKTDINTLLHQFRQLRQVFVSNLLQINDEDLLKTSSHPRLKTPMRIIDLAYFVAEHDDHHLANISSLLLL